MNLRQLLRKLGEWIEALPTDPKGVVSSTSTGPVEIPPNAPRPDYLNPRPAYMDYRPGYPIGWQDPIPEHHFIAAPVQITENGAVREICRCYICRDCKKILHEEVHSQHLAMYGFCPVRDRKEGDEYLYIYQPWACPYCNRQLITQEIFSTNGYPSLSQERVQIDHEIILICPRCRTVYRAREGFLGSQWYEVPGSGLRVGAIDALLVGEYGTIRRRRGNDQRGDDQRENGR